MTHQEAISASEYEDGFSTVAVRGGVRGGDGRSKEVFVVVVVVVVVVMVSGFGRSLRIWDKDSTSSSSSSGCLAGRISDRLVFVDLEESLLEGDERGGAAEGDFLRSDERARFASSTSVRAWFSS